MALSLYFDSRWYGAHGIGRFAKEVRGYLPSALDLGGALKPSSPLDTVYLACRLAMLPRNALFYSPGYNAPLATRRRFVLTVHDLSHIDFPGARTALKALYYELILKPACRRALAVVTVSEYSKRRICEWSGIGGDKVFNVGNGVGQPFEISGKAHSHPRPYVLCVGNRKAHKNEIRTLHAFASLKESIPHDCLMLGSPTASLTAAIDKLELEARVHFLGLLSDEALARVYRGAGAVLFASLYEGFGLPVIEAMACGAPVITSSVCALPEVAGDAAVLVCPESVEQIADALQRVLCELGLSSNLKRRGIENASRYSWRLTGERLRAVIESYQ